MLEELAKELLCPYCHKGPLKPVTSFISVMSGKFVDWFKCPRCEAPIEVINGEIQVERVAPPTH